MMVGQLPGQKGDWFQMNHLGVCGSRRIPSPSSRTQLHSCWCLRTALRWRALSVAALFSLLVSEMGWPSDAYAQLISTVAGVWGGGYLVDGRPATETKLGAIFGVCVDPDGNLYLAEPGEGRIRMVERSANTVVRIAGNGNFGLFGDGGLATNASLGYPVGITVDAQGNVLFADQRNHRIRKVIRSTGRIYTVAGGGGGFREGGYGGDGGPATDALLQEPASVAVDGYGDVYITDTSNHRIRRVDAVSGLIETIAGTGEHGYYGDNGPATDAHLWSPHGLWIDGGGDLYFSDSDNNVVRRIRYSDRTITTVAGIATNGSYAGDGGQATDSRLNHPEGLCVDNDGNLFIADRYNHRIRRVDGKSGIISTVAGDGREYYTVYDQAVRDYGAATEAHVSWPTDVAVDSYGNLFIADKGFGLIRKVNLGDYTETFSTPDAVKQWDVDEEGTWRVEQGALTVSGYPEGVMSLQPGEYFENDIDLTVETVWIQGVDSYGYGVHFKSGPLGMYRFLLSGNGAFRLDRWDTQIGEAIVLVDWTFDGPAESRGENSVRIRTEGSVFSFYLNGQLVVSWTEGDPGGGYIGLQVHDVQEVSFDNFSVAGPRASSRPVITPELSVSVQSIDFGQVMAGDTKSLDVEISNSGQGLLQILGVVSDSPIFTTDVGRFSLAPDESRVISVRYSPTEVGPSVAELSIKSNDPDRDSLKVVLVGRGLKMPKPRIRVSAGQLGFLEVGVGRTDTAHLTVGNAGDAALRVTEIVASSPVFSATPSVLELLPGEEQILDITFLPQETGVAFGQLSVHSNDPDTPETLVVLSGSGIEVNPPSASIAGASPNPAVWSAAEEILFSGTARDNDQDGASIVRLEWSSDLDGKIHTGNSSDAINFSVPIKDLSIGKHTVTLKVWDNEGDSVEVRSTFEVRGLEPVASIDSAAVNDVRVGIVTLRSGLDDLTLYGSALDPDEFGQSIASHRWSFRSDSDGYALERVLSQTQLLEVSAERLGLGRHWIYYSATDDEGQVSPVDSIEAIVRARFGRAIIVAGGDQNLVFNYSLSAANNVYHTLLGRRRFESQDIVYLSPVSARGYWKDVQVTDSEVTVDRLHREIVAAKKDNVELAIPLLVFLAGHGGVRTFQLSDGEILKPEDLKSWLDELTTAKVSYRGLQSARDVPPDEIIVVVDFCYSRTFLEGICGPGRVVIGSSLTEVASVIGGSSFAESFFRWLALGGEEANLWRSFTEARDQMAQLFPQAPFIDVNGDGIPLLDENGSVIAGQEGGVELARRMYVGGEIGGQARTLGADAELYSVSATELSPSRYAFVAKGDPGLVGLNLSFAAVPEGGSLPASGEAGTGVLDRLDAAESDTVLYRGEYAFGEAGQYTVLILGADDLGNFAGQRQIQIQVAPKLVGDFNNDDEVDFQDFILFAQVYGKDSEDPEWDMVYDLDDSSQVDFQDFLMFAAAYEG
jgi:sugar lactone lactonase YvrE